MKGLVELGEAGEGEMRVIFDGIQMRSQMIEFVVGDKEGKTGLRH